MSVGEKILVGLLAAVLIAAWVGVEIGAWRDRRRRRRGMVQLDGVDVEEERFDPRRPW